MPTLHVHLDESGDMGFKPQGSKYYIFCVSWTYGPRQLATELMDLRFQHNKYGDDICRFHAMVDGPRRPYVYNTLLSYHDWYFNAIMVEKRKVNPFLYDPLAFYPRFASIPLKFVLGYQMRAGTTNVMIYTDRLPVAKHKDAVEKAIKTSCRAVLGHSLPFQVFHHPGESNSWLQATDYCCWGFARKWEKGKPSDFNILRGRYRGKELDVLSHGTTTYY
jgi:hypothetical protein